MQPNAACGSNAPTGQPPQGDTPSPHESALDAGVQAFNAIRLDEKAQPLHCSGANSSR